MERHLHVQLPCLLRKDPDPGSEQIITIPDPRGPNPYGSNGSGTVLVRKSYIEITPRMYNKHTLQFVQGRSTLIVNSTKTYFFAEPKLRFEARLARDESRSPVITWSQTHYSVLKGLSAIKKIFVPNRNEHFSSSRKCGYVRVHMVPYILKRGAKHF